MSGVFATIMQICVGAFIIWGLFHENKLIRLEDRIAAAVRRRFGRRGATCRAAEAPRQVKVQPARGRTGRPAPSRVCPSRRSHCA